MSTKDDWMNTAAMTDPEIEAIRTAERTLMSTVRAICQRDGHTAPGRFAGPYIDLSVTTVAYNVAYHNLAYRGLWHTVQVRGGTMEPFYIDYTLTPTAKFFSDAQMMDARDKERAAQLIDAITPENARGEWPGE
ncbi:MAG: hypothetical protein WC657_07100 [Candidatus Paceibacterota bacterium]|jgi:hypothetical protein